MKLNYWEQLERAARWRLPRKEADDLLNNYQQTVCQSSSTDTQLILNYGAPQQLVVQHAHPKHYLMWMSALALMVVCLLLLPAEWFLSGHFFLLSTTNTACPVLLLALGSICAIGWFQRQGIQEPVHPLPHGFLRLLFIPAVGIALVWCISGFIFTQVHRLGYLHEVSHGIISGFTIARILETVTIASVITGIFSLIRARLDDRRWRTIYVLSLTSITLSMAVGSLLTNMDISGAIPGLWYLPDLIYFTLLSAAGLLGTFVSLRLR